MSDDNDNDDRIDDDNADYWRGLIDPRVNTPQAMQALVTPPAGAAAIEAMRQEVR